MKKCICVEKRIKNSQRLHYNEKGDWLPRYIVWPEYDGYTKEAYFPKKHVSISSEIQREWGMIVSQAIRSFIKTLALRCTGFESEDSGYYVFDVPETKPDALPPPVSSWIVRLSRLFLFWRRRHIPYQVTLDAEHFNMCQEYYAPYLYLLHHHALSDEILQTLRHSNCLDRTNLLSLGVVIFSHGIEEAVLELAFAQEEETFLTCLEIAANQMGYRMELTSRHFLSDWIVANKKAAMAKYGDKWNKF